MTYIDIYLPFNLNVNITYTHRLYIDDTKWIGSNEFSLESKEYILAKLKDTFKSCNILSCEPDHTRFKFNIVKE